MMKTIRKEIRGLKTFNEAMNYIKSQAIKNSVVKTVHLTNQTFMLIEGEANKARIIKTLKLYKTKENIFLLAIYHYEENSMAVKAVDIAIYDKEPCLPNPDAIIFSLSKLLIKNSKFYKHYDKENCLEKVTC